MKTAQVFFGFFIIVKILCWAWLEYLRSRQKRKKKETAVPAVLKDKVPEGEFERSQHYNLDKLNFATYQDLANLLIELGFYMTGIFPYLWDGTKTAAKLVHLSSEGDVRIYRHIDYKRDNLYRRVYSHKHYTCHSF
jgi:hypothetical protein